jgi:hypothetical protein
LLKQVQIAADFRAVFGAFTGVDVPTFDRQEKTFCRSDRAVERRWLFWTRWTRPILKASGEIVLRPGTPKEKSRSADSPRQLRPAAVFLS